MIGAMEQASPSTDLFPVPFEHSLAVLHRGRILHAEGDTARVLDLASVTKVLAARATLVAVDQGYLGLDDPMGPPGATLRHLMSHSSGLSQDSDVVLAAPGARRIYSNRGIEVMGRAVEAATATALDRWIEQTVLEPLGMVTADVPGSPAWSGRASVEDLMALAGELLHPVLVSPALDEEATKPVFPDLVGVVPGYGRQTPNPWGLGVEIRGHKHPHWTAPDASPWVFGHFGQSGSFLWVDRRLDAAAAFLGVEPFGPWHREHWSRLNQEILGLIASD
jgi:CubicO group peptidase (beta-lactamase class C family)